MARDAPDDYLQRAVSSLNVVRQPRALLLLVLAFACGPASQVSSLVPTQSPARVGEGDPPARSRYQVGDWVEYRYDGTFTESPVTLREEITASRGIRLRIDVHATRADETRSWVQVVTDTPENQRDNVVDALFERQGDRFVRLANDHSQDIFRLYEWVVLMPDGPATDVTRQVCTKSIAGKEYKCECTTGRNHVGGRPVLFEQSSCPDFTWTHGPGRFWDEESGEDVLRVWVQGAGRRAQVEPLPLEPTTAAPEAQR